MKSNDYELHACRDKVFDRLCDIWYETKKTFGPDKGSVWYWDIWRKANTLQAVAQYWHSGPDAGRTQKAMDLMRDGYEFYNERKGEAHWWVDDFGWWGGFFGDLADYTVTFPQNHPFDGDNLGEETKYCYDRMLKNFDEKDGGIWNQTSGDRSSEKNTITNTWMLNLASTLYYSKHIRDYADKAADQYVWLTTGKYKNNSPESWRLYTSDDPSKAFLLWRPGPIDTASKSYWSGDEGVFLRGRTIYANWVVTDPTVKSELLRNSKSLINAAINTETGFPDKENVMHESPNLPDPPGWDTNLVTGKGVFMRLVTRFVKTHAFFADKEFEGAFKRFVNATAESVCREIPKNADKTKWVIGPDWNPDSDFAHKEGPPNEDDTLPQVLQTAGLDALNAAVSIM